MFDIFSRVQIPVITQQKEQILTCAVCFLFVSAVKTIAYF